MNATHSAADPFSVPLHVLEQHLLGLFLGSLLLALIVTGIAVVVVTAWGSWELWREDERQASCREELRQRARSDGTRPLWIPTPGSAPGGRIRARQLKLPRFH